MDDEEVVREVTRSTLESFGYRVIVAEDGVKALSVYTETNQRERVAAVVMDMMMPNMDGPSTIAVLTRINPEIRIIATSGISDYAVKACSLGAKRFIQKPSTTEVLLKEMRLVLEARA